MSATRFKGCGTVGGSLVAPILGKSKWAGPHWAYHVLRGLESEESKPELARGKVLESSVLELWRQRSGLTVLKPDKVMPDTMPWAHASLDAFSLVALDEGMTPLLLEAKTGAWSDEWGEDGTDQIPREYALQCTWYAGVARAAGWRVAEWVEVPALLGHYKALQAAAVVVARTGAPLSQEEADALGLELRVYRVPWEPRLFEAIKDLVLEFLENHVWPGFPPTLGPEEELLERDRKALALAHKGRKGLSLEWEHLGPGARADVEALIDASAQRKAWEGVEKQHIARVQALMGDATEIEHPSGARVLWSTGTSGRRFTVKQGGQ